MYKADLSQRACFLRLLYVGWLERGQPFPQGKVPDNFKRRLLGLCSKSMKTRGFHKCTFCIENQELKKYLHRGKPISMGNGEFQVKGRHLKTYFAPDLIYHYIVEHGYRPPDQFIDAVLHPRRILTFDCLVMATLACSCASVLSFYAGYEKLQIVLMVPIFAVVFIGVGLGFSKKFVRK